MSSVLLHHDSITGTHGASVNSDYKRIIANNNQYLSNAQTQLIQKLETKSSTDEKEFGYLLFNPNAHFTINTIVIDIDSPYI